MSEVQVNTNLFDMGRDTSHTVSHSCESVKLSRVLRNDCITVQLHSLVNGHKRQLSIMDLKYVLISRRTLNERSAVQVVTGSVASI